MLSFQGLTFCSMLLKRRNSHLWYAWLYALAPPSRALSSLRCVVSARDGGSGARSLTYSGAVTSVDVPVDKVVAGSDCLVLTDDFVIRLLQRCPNEEKEDEDEMKFLLAIQYEVKVRAEK